MATPPLGPQYKDDDAFIARVRLHQSWYRAAVLAVDCGVGPSHAFAGEATLLHRPRGMIADRWRPIEPGTAGIGMFG